MSILSFIKKVCTQKAIYWEYEGVDVYNNPILTEAREVLVRWDEKTEIKMSNSGKEFVSRAQILTPENLKEQSYIMLGALEDVPIEPNHSDYEEAFSIRLMERTPLLQSDTQDVFMAYL